jgi:hypothetical protein
MFTRSVRTFLTNTRMLRDLSARLQQHGVTPQDPDYLQPQLDQIRRHLTEPYQSPNASFGYCVDTVVHMAGGDAAERTADMDAVRRAQQCPGAKALVESIEFRERHHSRRGVATGRPTEGHQATLFRNLERRR